MTGQAQVVGIGVSPMGSRPSAGYEGLTPKSRFFHVVHYHVSAIFVSLPLMIELTFPLTAHLWASLHTLFSAAGSIIINTRPEVGTFCRTRKRSETYLIS